MRFNIVSWAVVMVAVVLLAMHYRHEPWPPHRVAGAAIFLLSLALVSIARFQLGHAFSVTAQARHLVTTGLYARVRNPIYVSAMLLFAGVALFFESFWPLLIIVVLIPIQIVRARKEAAVLEAAFGEEYVQYRSRTWF